MEEIIFYFIVYAFLGWCVEVSYQTLKRGEFINRGFLNGPYCPIYGFGVLLILKALVPYQNHLLVLFLGATVLTTLLELFTGYFLWKIFKMRWWDYSDMPYNLGGFITPLFSIAWGLACVFVVKIIHPSIHELFVKLPEKFIIGFNIITLIFLTIDIVGTVGTILKLNKNLRRVGEINKKLRTFSDDIGETIYEGVSKTKGRVDKLEGKTEAVKVDLKAKREELNAEKERLLKDIPWTQKRLLRAFPRAKHLDLNKSLEEVRKYIKKK